MKKIRFHWSVRPILLAVLPGLFLFNSFVNAADRNGHVADEIIIGYKLEATEDQIRAVESKYGIIPIEKFPSLTAIRYKLPSSAKPEDIGKQIGQEPAVRYAEPNYLHKLQYLTPDPAFSKQWYLENTGQIVNGTRGVNGQDIGYRSAMGVFTPNSNPIVAVIDTGVALDHPEINASLLNVGWDFVENRSAALDQNGHGTLVASIIAGVSGNGIGINGIAPSAKILALRVGNDVGQFSTTGIVNALLYAANNGARIVNCSFGGLNFSSMQYDAFSQLRAKGILAVIAAGNGGNDHIGDNNDVTPTYPANYNFDNIISVAAVDQDGRLAGFSNYGPSSVHMAAPGTNIYGADIKFNVTQSVNFNSIPASWTTWVLPDSASTRPWRQWVDPSGVGWLTSSTSINGTEAFYENLTDTYAQSPPITLGFAPTIFYWAAYDLEYLYDWVFIEVSADGGVSWQTVDFITGTNITPSYGTPGTQRRIDLSGYDSKTVLLRFRLKTDSAASQGRCEAPRRVVRGSRGLAGEAASP